MTIDTDGVAIYSDGEVRECLADLVARGVDIDAIPGDKTVGFLFDLRGEQSKGD